MLRRIHDPDRGASFVEYSAVIMLVAAIMAVLIGSGIPTTLRDGVTGAVDSIFDGTGADQGNVPVAGNEEQDPLDSPPAEEEQEDASSRDDEETVPGPAEPQIQPAADTSENTADAGGGLLDSTWRFLTGAGGGIADDATDLVDTVLNPIDTATEMATSLAGDVWAHGLETADQVRERLDEGDYLGAAETFLKENIRYGAWESPLSVGSLYRSVVDEEVTGSWSSGDYAGALGRGAWNLGSYFIPGVGWLGRGGKLTQAIAEGTPDPPGANTPHFHADGADPGQPPPNSPDDRPDQDGQDSQDGDGSSCARNSFVPGTLVLMADGAHRPIEDVGVGDHVWATDPLTGESGPRPVTDLIDGHGPTTLVEITVTDTDGDTGRLTATDGHPFWVPTAQTWTDAIDLTPGAWLQTSAGTWIQVTALDIRTAHQRVHNLTVADLHTYHVAAGRTDVLVHNDACRLVPGGGLQAHEDMGGHTLERHVGVSDEYLRNRTIGIGPPSGRVATRWTDRETAERAVATVLDQEKVKIEEWLERVDTGSKGYVRLELENIDVDQGVLGTSFARQGSKKNPTGWVEGAPERVTVVLERDPDSPLGYSIYTAYPVE
ncbi:hypothetical protein GCM10027294_31080 [Marinactinospora endophytica]